MDVEFELYPIQDDFFHCDDNFTGFIGGIGSGKTYVGSLKAISKAMPKTVGMVVAPTYGMLRDSTLRTFNEIAENYILNFKRADMITTMAGGGEILWRSADDPQHLRGPNLDWAWIEEGGLTHSDTFKITIGRLRKDGKFGACWTTSTPKGRRNWLYEQSAHMTMFKATTLDNPFTSEEWKKSLLDTYTGKFLAQEVYADFVSFEGLIYNEFEIGTHVKKRDINDFVEMGLGVDEGFTNPAVILKVYKDRDGAYHVGEEWYKTGKVHEEIVEQGIKMAETYNPDVLVDASAAGLIEAFRKAGLMAVSRRKRVLDGISRVQELLKVQKNGKPRLTIDPSCVNLINEFESYVWKEGRDEPVKEFDHALDALRYYVMGSETTRVATQRKY